MDDWISSDHIPWFSQQQSIVVNNCSVDIYVFNHQQNELVFSSWARHFRNHYCLDGQIDRLKSPGQSRRDYLNNIKLPSIQGFGPGVRSGDFSEILVADYLQFILNYDVPRYRWRSKIIRDESPKGSDVIGFSIATPRLNNSPDDTLAIYEVKAKFSKNGDNTLQTAINDSAKDHIRIAESLNFIKQQAINADNINRVDTVSRFQNPTDYPYRERYGAVLVISEECCDISTVISNINISTHPNQGSLFLLIIKGSQMMTIVHELYKRVADEA